MTTKTAFLHAWLGFALLLCSSGVSQTVVDPVSSYTAKYHRKSGDQILKLEYDMDHDGNEDMFLAYTSNVDPRDGDCGWTLYLKRGSGYLEALGLSEDGSSEATLGITFNVNVYSIGNVPELGKWGLLTTETSTGKFGGVQLKAVLVVGNNFKMVDVGRFSADPQTPIGTPPPSRFATPPTPAIQYLNP